MEFECPVGHMTGLHMKTCEHIQWCVGGSHGCELFYQLLHFISKKLQKYDYVTMQQKFPTLLP